VSLLEDTLVADLQDQYEDNDFIPACPWQYRIQQAPADYGYLVGKYPKGAYYQHHTWRAPLLNIVLKLLETSASEDEETATRGLAARHCRLQRRKVLTPIELLRSIEVIPDKAIEIIRIAREWLPSRRALPKTWPKSNVEHSPNRLSSATVALGTLQDLLTGVPAVPVPHLSSLRKESKSFIPRVMKGISFPTACGLDELSMLIDELNGMYICLFQDSFAV
jgi:hypothetical protein